MTNWVKCSDRLPDYDDNVLFTDGRYIDIGYRTAKDTLYCVAASMLRSLPTYWQPLPSLPKENE